MNDLKEFYKASHYYISDDGLKLHYRDMGIDTHHRHQRLD